VLVTTPVSRFPEGQLICHAITFPHESLEQPILAKVASLHPAASATVHQYILKSRGREYAKIIVRSHSPNAHDPPVLYFGEDISGYVILSLSDLSDMQSMDVVVSQFPN